jgi:hypothetical protein
MEFTMISRRRSIQWATTIPVIGNYLKTFFRNNSPFWDREFFRLYSILKINFSDEYECDSVMSARLANRPPTYDHSTGTSFATDS